MNNFDYYRDFDDFQRRETINFFLAKFPFASKAQLDVFLEQAKTAYVKLRTSNPKNVDWNQMLVLLLKKFGPEARSEKERLKRILSLQEQLKVRLEGEINRQVQQNNELFSQLKQSESEIIQMQQLVEAKEHQIEALNKQLHAIKEANKKLIEEHESINVEELLKEYEVQCNEAIYKRDQHIQTVFEDKLALKDGEISETQSLLKTAEKEKQALKKAYKLVVNSLQKHQKLTTEIEIDFTKLDEIIATIFDETKNPKTGFTNFIKQFEKTKAKLTKKIAEITKLDHSTPTNYQQETPASQQQLDQENEPIKPSKKSNSSSLPRGTTQPKSNSINRVSKLID
ncbi:hypothetical protein [Mycoplasmoides genitalium]